MQEYASTAYLNLAAVQGALHVKLVGKSSFQFSTGLDYNKTKGSLLEEYATALLPNFRILQFSGDADPCVPYTGTQRWIDSLNLTIAQPWRPWTPKSTSIIAGYTQVYVNNLTFATIRDAGHMAPRYPGSVVSACAQPRCSWGRPEAVFRFRYKPTQALHMIQSFLAKRPL